MVGLNNVIQVFDLTVYCLLKTFPFIFELSDSFSIRGGLIRIDFQRFIPILETMNGFPQKPLSRMGVASRREVKVNGVPFLIYGPIQIEAQRPLTLTYVSSTRQLRE